MDETETTQRQRKDWPELRAWANLAVAGAALFVSIVAVWTTAQISGLEDYLRSEIALRNSELNDATRDARGLDERVQQSTARLEELRSNADRLVVSSTEAQTRIAEAQNSAIGLLTDKQRTSAALATSREQLAAVTTEIATQRNLLENYRREEVLSRAISTFSYLQYADMFRGERKGARRIDGPYALNEMRNFGLDVRDEATRDYFASIRTIGSATCRGLSNFTPKFPETADTPELEKLKGKPTDRGTILTTNKELEAWNKRFSAWSEEWSRVSAYNDSIRLARQEAGTYIRNALWHCSCVALKGSSACDKMPERPDISELIKERP